MSGLAHTSMRRGRLRLADDDLQTTRLVGRGWTWECDCGEKGAWEAERKDALEHARIHRLYKHGQR